MSPPSRSPPSSLLPPRRPPPRSPTRLPSSWISGALSSLRREQGRRLPWHRREPGITLPISWDGTGRRIRPPSRNALFAVFQREDEGSRAAQVASSWAEQTGESKRMDQELEPQVSHSENLYRVDLPALGFVVVVRFSMRLVIDTVISWSQFS
ncbi:hypothetical protein ZEAMMB73_Zm00001d036530 [Zea mays]|uniref:Uncharacterized protein n=2 Tax=Zea mays TaxID=4577 RepID=A0A1D6LP41_MAIZE|nr:hypothetical protein ZEAMMB73_Zm00001d036530 [Zea mays]AQK81275.1 hypothetical protein ZEAMMB73_Zm00001d036530 [Zea mays]